MSLADTIHRLFQSDSPRRFVLEKGLALSYDPLNQRIWPVHRTTTETQIWLRVGLGSEVSAIQIRYAAVAWGIGLHRRRCGRLRDEGATNSGL